MRETFREGGTKASWMTKGKYLKYVYVLRFVERELVAKKQPEDIKEFRAESQGKQFCPLRWGMGFNL